ncbi:MAG: glycosyltransferase [Actinomycetota bacterium]|nr:glycosyltransferase [Actinomycetota bacterium]
MAVDVLLVSLGGTAGLRAADAQLAGALRRAGAQVAEAPARLGRELPTFALHDLSQAHAARSAARAAIAEHDPRSILYSSTTAALLWPRPGAIRFDAPAADNRPGRHGVWQRPVERRRMAQAPLLVPMSEAALARAPATRAEAVIVSVPIETSGPPGERDIAAVTYGADPVKRRLDDVLSAWSRARRGSESLVVAGATGTPVDGVRFAGMLDGADFRSLLRRARVFVTAPRREDFGQTQLEALADGTMLVTTPASGAYAALPIARRLDPRLVTEDLAGALRTALDDPAAGYAERAGAELAPFRRETVDRIIAEELLPRLVRGRSVA